MKKQILISYFPKITFKRYQSLLHHFKDFDSAWKAEFSDFGNTCWEPNIINEFLSWKETVNESALETILEKEHITPISFDDTRYPPLLKEIHDPPVCLFVRGNIDNLHYPIAVVGTRKSSPYGAQVTETLVKDLCEAGMTIVSGLALGIDGIAHSATLTYRGRTLAVLGSGIDTKTIYPRAHQHLAEKIIASNGAILSEYPPYTKGTPYSFPRRNRIIAAISLGTLVIEAQASSGALITAQCALEYNREVFAVPQNIYSPTSLGPNNLIKMGARPVTQSEDILHIFGLQKKQTPSSALSEENTAEENLVLQTLSQQPMHIDTLQRSTSLPTHTLGSTLTLLEMKGKVRNLGSMNYILL